MRWLVAVPLFLCLVGCKEKTPIPRADAGDGPKLGEVAKDGSGKAKAADAVLIETIRDDYRENEVAAKAKYQGKTLDVAGDLVVVRDGPKLCVADWYNPIQKTYFGVFECKAGETAKAAKLQPSDDLRVTVRGVCRGVVGGKVVIGDCVIVESKANTPIDPHKAPPIDLKIKPK